MTIEDDDRVTTAERYAKALTSGNLVPSLTRQTDLDVMLAAGAAVRASPDRMAALRIQRMIETRDTRDLWSVVEHYDNALAQYLDRGGRRMIPKAGRRYLVTQILHWMMHMGCDYCGGTGKIAEEGTAGTRTDICPACHGAGVKPLSREVPHVHARTALWLVDEIHKHSREAIRQMRVLLRR